MQYSSSYLFLFKQIREIHIFLFVWLIFIFPFVFFEAHLKGKCLPSKISELSESIAVHLEHVSVTKKKIRQMELIYKVDETDNLYLLFC